MMADMSASALAELLRVLEAASLPVWLDGGWGVDALLGTQTRLHKDVDIVLELAHLPTLNALMSARGYFSKQGEPAESLVLTDGRDLEIDVHPVRFDAAGNGIYRMANGEDWSYPAQGFTGRGSIDGMPVRCISPEVQVLCHAEGYTPTDKDRQDMGLLAAKFGLELPPHLRPAP
jgi:lincosamide nucleotidyltransferase A/C/D/E